MGRSSKEKLYQSNSEHRRNAAIRAGTTTAANIQGRLPFGHCALTLRPFVQAVMIPTANPSVLYEQSALLPFVLKYGRDPCTGKPCTTTDLVTLQMEHGNNDDNYGSSSWQCPILHKALSSHSKIVAIRENDSKNKQSANVYSYQAYQTLNVQTKNFTDLITGEPFDPQTDVWILQDPQHPHAIPPMEQFYYITHANEFVNDDDDKSNANGNNIQQSATAKRILAQLEKSKTKTTGDAISSPKTALSSLKRSAAATITSSSNNDDKDTSGVILAQDVTGVALTSAAGAASFTSTGMDAHTANVARPATADEILTAQCNMLRSLRTKGYVRLHTTVGPMVLEIHADMVPRTAMNFLGLCAAGRYDGTQFHRLIPNFMIQGGKAVGEETQESSLWGDAFGDEFDNRCKHNARGIVAMANAGPHTNKQQFYITFAPCPHLDRKHSVFGLVVRGMDILDQMESVGGDKNNNNKPLVKLLIERTEILANPVETALAKESKRIQKLQQARAQKAANESATVATAKKAKTSGASNPSLTSPLNKNDSSSNNDATAPGIGKYLTKNRLTTSGGSPTMSTAGKRIGIKNVVAPVATTGRKNTPKKKGFGNFSGW